MQVLEVRNVHDALIRGVDLLEAENFREQTRNGEVYRSKTPVTTVYEKPKERVLFWEERDANPFFHFMEGLWMLTGRNDLEFVKRYAGAEGPSAAEGRFVEPKYVDINIFNK